MQTICQVKLPKHLGGHANITHIDIGALMYIKDKFNIYSMIDIGCGIGEMVEIAIQNGINAIGIDGDINQSSNKKIVIHDFTNGIIDIKEIFDLGWSIEFVEHVEEKFINNFMNLFIKCKYICLTHAPVGKGGHYHVNCRNSEYWIETFKKYSLIFNENITKEIRSVSTMKREFMRKNGLFFINKSLTV